MKKCLVCGWPNTDDSKICCKCRHYFPEEPEYYGYAIRFFQKSAGLITIIASIFAIITLVPLFLTFLLGENWFNQLIGSTLGFECVILILISTFFAAFFVYYLLCLMVVDFINKMITTKEVPFLDRVYSFVGVLSMLVVIGSLILFLCFVWFTKFEPIMTFTGLELILWVMIPAFILLIGGMVHFYKESKRCLYKCIFLILSAAVIVILILFILNTLNGSFFLIGEMNQYHEKKTANVTIIPSEQNRSLGTPTVLKLNRTIEGFSLSKNVTEVDRFYAQCHWTTNYGYFFTTILNNSVIGKKSQDLVILSCPDSSDRVYWTYDIADFSKRKPHVLIGLNLEDSNKKIDNLIGSDHLLINWTDNDTYVIENVSTIYT